LDDKWIGCSHYDGLEGSALEDMDISPTANKNEE
jgi:hypothetical protein